MPPTGSKALLGWGLSATFSLACQPGVLDCAKVTCPDAAASLLPVPDASQSSDTRPDGFGSGGDAGTLTGSVSALTGVMGCKYPTVGELESKLLAVKCGTASCHDGAAGGSYAPNLKTPNAWSRLVDIAPSLACRTEKYIALGNPSGSYFVAKVRDSAPKCSDGTAAGSRMPLIPGPLAQDEIDCVVAYANAITGK